MNKLWRCLSIGAIMVVALNARGQSNSNGLSISPQAKTYLEKALQIIEDNFALPNLVDFKRLRAKALEAAQNAQTPAQTYDAIRVALSIVNGALSKPHSFLLTPEQAQPGPRQALGLSLLPTAKGFTIILVVPNSSAAEANLQVGDIIEKVNGKVPTSPQDFSSAAGSSTLFEVRRGGQLFSVTLSAKPVNNNLPPVVQDLGSGIGYIELPSHSLDGELVGEALLYHEIAHRDIARVDASPRCGWVVDLRRNAGGNSYPMFAAVGPILGEGLLVRYIYGNQQVEDLLYTQGRAEIAGEVISQVSKPYVLQKPMPPVVVLTSEATNSAGEAVLVGFKGRPNTLILGEASNGRTSGNDGFRLADGAILVVSIAFPQDRSGVLYDGKVQPDRVVANEWSYFGSAQDPLLIKATDWLKQQPACKTN